MLKLFSSWRLRCALWPAVFIGYGYLPLVFFHLLEQFPFFIPQPLSTTFTLHPFVACLNFLKVCPVLSSRL